jgi:hypothetical protein
MGRFLAMKEYQELIEEPVLHIESDVILSSDFPFNKFSTLKELTGFPLISEERGVASILYIKDSEAASRLVETMMEEIQSDTFTSDMLILGKHYKNGESVCALPIGPSSWQHYRQFTPQKLQNSWEELRRYFGGVFDGADIGIYFFGTDPRNARGKSYFQREIPTEFGNTKNWKLEYSESRNFIDFKENESNISVFCLHVTSKQLSMFRVKLPRKLIQRRIKHSNNEKEIVFIRVVLLQASKALKRRVGRLLQQLR